MAEPAHDVVPPETAAWICRQQRCSRDGCQECRHSVNAELCRQATRLTGKVCRTAASGDDRLAAYAVRLWSCFEFHWRRLADQQTIKFDQLAQRLEAGDLGYERSSADVLLEVTLAQAMEFNEPKAALMFETDYMPLVMSTARRVGGPRATDAFQNFAAELILPRENRPPRIAGYQGRTSLRSWLRTVVTNHWVSRQRKREAVAMSVLPESTAGDDPAITADYRPCTELLRPLLGQAVGKLDAEDRLLIKMLFLDEVPQKQLAENFGIHSGNLTRRRQRIAAAVWQGVQQLAQQTDRPKRAEECLQLVLAGEDRSLKQQLGQVLTRALSEAPGNTEENS